MLVNEHDATTTTKKGSSAAVAKHRLLHLLVSHSSGRARVHEHHRRDGELRARWLFGSRRPLVARHDDDTTNRLHRDVGGVRNAPDSSL